EVAESIMLLRGKAPEDLMEVTLALAAEMIMAGGKASAIEEGTAQAKEAIRSGAALERFKAMVRAQGGDPSVLDEPGARMSKAIAADVHAPEGASGFVDRIDALDVGRAMIELGAGRRTKEDNVDPLAGCVFFKRQGDPVASGDVIARVTASNDAHLDRAVADVARAYRFAPIATSSECRVRDRFSNGCWEGRMTAK
ncbi:MAG: thymidine phosphorylase, partial [Bacteroidetes bacterium]|nr:thymidine phosphorylase [Bacteroidota bacterium]